ncbi:GntR family transcriptional regulator [Pseudonocardia bannensis]
MDELPVSTSRRLPRKSGATRKASPYERLKQAIMSGELPPGEPLVELALAEWCNVSRTPVREALTRLEQDGLIQRNDRGLIVRESSPEEILDIYDTRIVLESKAAAVAAERRTSIDLVAMRRAEERAHRVDTDDPHALAERNREFHRTVWRASRNESLIDLLERLNLHLGRYPATTLAYPGRQDTSHVEHHDLVDAIEARDPETASAIATRHFTAARDIRLRLWESE